jgi:hypothetical protein
MNKTNVNKTNVSADSVNVLPKITDVLTSVSLLNSSNNNNYLEQSHETFAESPTSVSTMTGNTDINTGINTITSKVSVASYVISVLLGLVYFGIIFGFPKKIFSDTAFMILMICVGLLNIILFSLTYEDSSRINEKISAGSCGHYKYSNVNKHEKNILIFGIIFQILISSLVAIYKLTSVESETAHAVLDILIYIATTFIMITIMIAGGIYLKAHECNIIHGIRGNAHMAILIFAMMVNSINYIVFSGKNFITFESYKLLSILGIAVAVSIIILTVAYWGSISEEDDQKKINTNVSIVGGLSIVVLVIIIIVYMIKFNNN